MAVGGQAVAARSPIDRVLIPLGGVVDVRALIVLDTRYGNSHKLAEAVAEGVRSVNGAEVMLRRVEITGPESIIRQGKTGMHS